MELTPAMNGFITHWGEMGVRWGINRTIAQIHALLYLSPDPISAEEIAETLLVARSNVSNSLRELQNWNLVRVVHLKGDRRDHFTTLHDVWEIFVVIGKQRFEREIAPTVSMLEQLAQKAAKDKATPAETTKRIAAMADFTAELQVWYSKAKDLPRSAISGFFKVTAGLRKLSNSGKRET
ncbi:GbsR/MarR family transcriptional regulator [Bryobacter aggregatus]|uniref:GbsR/MarR family transcriptional regulator n=1 Tax=Bryobacter aggregatus TaxID=360054 RepID=UPI0004E2660E|nr:MarR family transcriptional regulator [Bryobacter aggregatus]